MKKIPILILIAALTIVSCNEEELILEENTDNNEFSQNTNCDNTNDNEISVSNKILDLVNEHRKSIGKSSLTLNCIAAELAVKHTKYMISKNDISHDNFNDRFQELQQRVNARSVGENVASGYATAESVMNAWLNSSGHKANIEGDFTHIGIAAVKNSQGRLYYTQLFYR